MDADERPSVMLVMILLLKSKSAISACSHTPIEINEHGRMSQSSPSSVAANSAFLHLRHWHGGNVFLSRFGLHFPVRSERLRRGGHYQWFLLLASRPPVSSLSSSSFFLFLFLFFFSSRFFSRSFFLSPPSVALRSSHPVQIARPLGLKGRRLAVLRGGNCRRLHRRQATNRHRRPPHSLPSSPTSRKP